MDTLGKDFDPSSFSTVEEFRDAFLCEGFFIGTSSYVSGAINRLKCLEYTCGYYEMLKGQDHITTFNEKHPFHVIPDALRCISTDLATEGIEIYGAYRIGNDELKPELYCGEMLFVFAYDSNEDRCYLLSGDEESMEGYTWVFDKTNIPIPLIGICGVIANIYIH